VAAERALADAQQGRNLLRATSTIQAKRAQAVAELDDWQQLRAAGAAIKDEVLAHLDDYLLQLEGQVTACGGTVHWARDANEANRIVTRLVTATGAAEVIKVKSMTTSCCWTTDARRLWPTRPAGPRSGVSVARPA
jgi:L-lactate dehydrogenase complex protein LldF